MTDLNSKPNSLTHIANISFDEDKQLIVHEIVGVDTDGVVRKVPVGTDGSLTTGLPTDASTSSNQDTQTTLLQGIAGFLPSAYDYFTYTSGSTTDTYVFKTGGSGGATVKTITITFVDTTKKVLSTVGAT